MSTPGKRLQRSRERIGKQQKEIAALIHKSLPAYKSWEQDKSRPRTFTDIENVCNAVGISVQEFITGEEWDMELPEIESRMLEALRQLPESQQQMFVLMLEALAKGNKEQCS